MDILGPSSLNEDLKLCQELVCLVVKEGSWPLISLDSLQHRWPHVGCQGQLLGSSTLLLILLPWVGGTLRLTWLIPDPPGTHSLGCSPVPPEAQFGSTLAWPSPHKVRVWQQVLVLGGGEGWKELV